MNRKDFKEIKELIEECVGHYTEADWHEHMYYNLQKEIKDKVKRVSLTKRQQELVDEVLEL